MRQTKYTVQNKKGSCEEMFRSLDAPPSVPSMPERVPSVPKKVQGVPNCTYAEIMKSIIQTLDIQHERPLNCYLQHKQGYVCLNDKYTKLQLKPLRIQTDDDFVFECKMAVIEIENFPFTIMVIRQQTPDPDTDAFLVGNQDTRTLRIVQKKEVLTNLEIQSKNCIFIRMDYGTTTSVFKLFDDGSLNEELYLSCQSGEFLLKRISDHPMNHPDTHFNIQSPKRQSIDHGGTNDEIPNSGGGANHDDEPKLNVNQNNNSHNRNLLKRLKNIFSGCFKRNNWN